MDRSFAMGNGNSMANGPIRPWWRDWPGAQPESSWTLTLGRDPA